MTTGDDAPRRAAVATAIGLLFWAWLAHGLMLVGGQVMGQLRMRLQPVDPFALVALVELATLALMMLAAARLPSGRWLLRVLALAAATHVALSVVDALTPNYDAAPIFGVAQKALLASWIAADLAGLLLLLRTLRRDGVGRAATMGLASVALLIVVDLAGLQRGLLAVSEASPLVEALLQWGPPLLDLVGTVLLLVFLGLQHQALSRRPRVPGAAPPPSLDLTARLALDGWRSAATGLRGFGNLFLAKVVLVVLAVIGTTIFAVLARGDAPPAWLPLPLGLASVLLSLRALSSLREVCELPAETGARSWALGALALLLTALVADIDSLVAAVEALVSGRSSAVERVLGGQLLSLVAVGVGLFVLLVALGRAARFLGDAALD